MHNKFTFIESGIFILKIITIRSNHSGKNVQLTHLQVSANGCNIVQCFVLTQRSVNTLSVYSVNILSVRVAVFAQVKWSSSKWEISSERLLEETQKINMHFFLETTSSVHFPSQIFNQGLVSQKPVVVNRFGWFCDISAECKTTMYISTTYAEFRKVCHKLPTT